jgi:hypothetical protein
VAGSLGLGVALLVIGLIGLVFFPWGGAVVALVGLIILIAFLLGLGRAAGSRRP